MTTARSMSIQEVVSLMKNFKTAEPEFSRWVSSREAFEIVDKSARIDKSTAAVGAINNDTRIMAHGLQIFIYENSFKATEFAWRFATQFGEKVLLTKMEGGKLVACVVNGPEMNKQMNGMLSDPFDFNW